MSNSTIHNVPSHVVSEGAVVHLHGPSNADITMTPKAALETAKRLGDAAVEAIVSELGSSMRSPRVS